MVPVSFILRPMLIAALGLVVTVGCSAPRAVNQMAVAPNEGGQETSAALPDLTPAVLDPDDRLQVVASTSIIADVAAQVEGERIELTSLMPIGTDPHSFEPTPRDLIALNNAHIIFLNGLGLEEGLESMLDSLDGDAAIISVNADVAALELNHAAHDHDENGGDTAHEAEAAEHADENPDHDHGDTDPHTWFSIAVVLEWTNAIEHALRARDPAHAET